MDRPIQGRIQTFGPCGAKIWQTLMIATDKSKATFKS